MHAEYTLMHVSRSAVLEHELAVAMMNGEDRLQIHNGAVAGLWVASSGPISGVKHARKIRRVGN